jgi:hypothetical protein
MILPQDLFMEKSNGNKFEILKNIFVKGRLYTHRLILVKTQ